MALVTVVLFIPLAYWCRSRIIFSLATLILLLALEISLFRIFDLLNHGLWGAIALTLPPALLWGYDDITLPKINSRIFLPLTINLAIWYLSLGFFYLSFQGIWNNFLLRSSSEKVLRQKLAG
ncbi:MAG: hypothetical protein QNJ68_12605 [Microcoleaceae cyanobacterium MO_207.B10]|nr:hypothetical protein [Microcoleaceae cyanobacterium MO_207.B10]